MKSIIGTLIVGMALLMVGCASSGPSLDDPSFEGSTETLNLDGQIELAVTSNWYPNTVLSTSWSVTGASTWHNAAHFGKLALTDRELAFLLWDEQEAVFMEVYEADYAHLTKINSKRHGMSQVVVVYLEDAVHSFTVGKDDRHTLHAYLRERGIQVKES